METIATPWMWAGFFGFVIAATAVDLKVLSARGATRVSVKEPMGWTTV